MHAHVTYQSTSQPLPRTDPDVYVNHAAIQEALGFSMVKDPEIQMPVGYKAPFNKQNLLRLMKSLLRSKLGAETNLEKMLERTKKRNVTFFR